MNREIYNKLKEWQLSSNRKPLIMYGARAKDFEIAIQWLIDAGLVHKVERTRDVKVPLKFYADIDAFKLYLLDIGLL